MMVVGGWGGLVGREGEWTRQGAPPQMEPIMRTPTLGGSGWEGAIASLEREGGQLWEGLPCCCPIREGRHERLIWRVCCPPPPDYTK